MGATSFLDRIKDEAFVPAFATNEACSSCLFARGNAPWLPDNREITPDMCHCQIYEPDDLGMKPTDVAYHGAECEYYEDEKAV
jgi:hypothetical protein